MSEPTTRRSKSLRNATSSRALCALERDNFDVGPKGEWGLMASPTHVYLSQQKLGEKQVQHIGIPRKFFDKLIDAYMAEQKSGKVRTP